MNEYDALIESCRACASGFNTNCDRCMFCRKDNLEKSCYERLHEAAADAIEKLSSFKEQITDGRFYVYKLGTLFELRHDPRDFVVEQQSYKEPPKEES